LFSKSLKAIEPCFANFLSNSDLEKRASASSYTTIPLGTSAKLVENCSEAGWVVLDPVWGKVTGLADIFRITIPDFQDEYESTLDHSSS
jgi:hypothetical protein